MLFPGGKCTILQMVPKVGIKTNIGQVGKIHTVGPKRSERIDSNFDILTEPDAGIVNFYQTKVVIIFIILNSR